MLHVQNLFEPRVLSQTTSSSSSGAPASFHFTVTRGWCATASVTGSALVEEGDSVVAAFVHVIRPSASRVLDFDRAVLECEVSFAGHLKQPEEKEVERMAKSVQTALLPAILLENYPKNTISISIKVLQSSAHDLAAAITAASAALVDAAVEVRDVVTAVTLQNTDPTLGPRLVCTVACLSALRQVSYSELQGEADATALVSLFEACQSQCSLLRASLLQSFSAPPASS